MPNAGLPQRIGGQFVYAAGPEYFAGVVPRFVSAGARIVGGCCGTTPEHIAAMRRALDAVAGADDQRARARTAGALGARDGARGPIPAAVTVAPDTPGAARDAPPVTGLLEALRAGRFVVSVEIDPPRSIRIDRTLDAARLLQTAGVDLVNISDSAMAR